MDLFLSNEKKIAGFLRHAIGIVGGVGVGFAIWGSGDVQGLIDAVDKIATSLEGLASAGMAAIAIGASLFAKGKAKLGA